MILVSKHIILGFIVLFSTSLFGRDNISPPPMVIGKDLIVNINRFDVKRTSVHSHLHLGFFFVSPKNITLNVVKNSDVLGYQSQSRHLVHTHFHATPPFGVGSLWLSLATLSVPLRLENSPPLKAGSRISAVLGSKRHLFPYGKEMANPRHDHDFLDGSAGGLFFLGGADLFCRRQTK